MSELIVVDIEKKIKDFYLEIKFRENEENIFVILGPSGCGKSTLLNSIAGIVNPDKGKIILDEKIIFCKEENINIPIYKRNLGYVQQKSNLFPHLTVIQNIKYGIKEESKVDLQKLIKILDIEDLKNKYLNEISGGQAQRVAIARTLITNPKVLLMDEPFSSLDNVMRINLRSVLLEVKRNFKIPIIFVTHDLEEAYDLADKIAVMDKGKFIQIDFKKNIFNYPRYTQVARFLGMKNIINGEIIKENTQEYLIKISNITLKISKSLMGLENKVLKFNNKNYVNIGVRPENINLLKDKNCNHENSFYVYVKKIICGITNTNIMIEMENSNLILNMMILTSELEKNNIKLNDRILVNIKKEHIVILKN